MVAPAEPTNGQRLGVVVVMRHGVAIAAFLAGSALERAGRQRLLDQGVRLGAPRPAGRVPDVPVWPVLPALDPAVPLGLQFSDARRDIGWNHGTFYQFEADFPSESAFCAA